MLINAIEEVLEKSGAIAPVLAKLDAGEDAGLSVPQSARPLMVASIFARRPRSMVVLVPGEDAADRFARSVAAFIGRERVHRIEERRDRPWSDERPDIAAVGRRLRAIDALRRGEPGVTVASARALLRCVPTDADISTPVVLRRDEAVEGLAYEEIPAALVARGYTRLDAIDGPGTFSVHGDTLDVWPSDAANPVRAGFFGDDIDELRRIVPTTGQSIGEVDECRLYPCTEVPLTAEGAKRAAHLLEPLARQNQEVAADVERMGERIWWPGVERYLPQLFEQTGSPLAHLSKDTLVVAIEPRALFDDASRGFDELSAAAQDAKHGLEGLYLQPAALDFGMQQRLTLLSILRVGGAVDAELTVRRPEVTGSEDKLYAELHRLVDAQSHVVFSAPDRGVRESMKLAFVEHALPIVEHLDSTEGRSGERTVLRPGVVNVVDTDIPAGLIIPGVRLGIVTIADVHPRSAHRRARRTIDPTATTFPYKPGDYVVHATHGIALFKEIVRQEVAGIERDYLQLEYAKGDKLFVPVEQIDRVTRFVGPTGAEPRLTRLNTADWSRATGKARKAASRLAFDLVDLYARRSTVTGFAYSPDTPWQREMEDDFPYEETDDQLAAIADVKADMESDKPMDRLICGDVGFGKTEVALRACFKAVQDRRQVMVLCPTTILAQQHFTTFSERMEPYGVVVEVLSRFRTDRQQQESLDGFAKGTVDILVGTHRLLSSDVNPKDLGLIIIDEEQRFGVQHKEQLKNLREQVDVLALSATPIPRTLQMALSGVRDMSLINTPPGKRAPVKVHVGEWNSDVVSEAIRFEVARGGQVYYVSNRVKSIDDAVARVLEAAPEARVAVAHGKLSSHEVESVMESFSAGEADVLVATTIIESGIDNPHTNTLIIEDSQRLGLAQLYQLKGRVGRSSRQAYAYFLFPAASRLTETAAERLTAIAENQELGSGMKIAMKDLEIRGAGTLLGAEQHGNMSAVGFDLFAQMLSEAVASARGESQIAYSDIKVDLPVQYFLPEEYLPAADERVWFYRRIAGAADDVALNRIAEDLRSRYGELPGPAENLIDRSRVKALAAELGATSVSLSGSKLVVQPVPKPRRGFGGVLKHGSYVDKRSRFLWPVDREQPLLPVAIDLLRELIAAVERDEEEADEEQYSAREREPEPQAQAPERDAHGFAASRPSTGIDGLKLSDKVRDERASRYREGPTAANWDKRGRDRHGFKRR